MSISWWTLPRQRRRWRRKRRGDHALDDFLSSLTPEQLAALDRVTESMADEAFDALDDADELMDELDEEIDRLFDGLDD